MLLYNVLMDPCHVGHHSGWFWVKWLQVWYLASFMTQCMASNAGTMMICKGPWMPRMTTEIRGILLATGN